MSSKRYPEEFKLEVASLILDQSYSILQACRDLDIGQTALRRWVTPLQHERTGQAPTAPDLKEEKKEI